jgi:3-oxoacyl-[acyl-carrier-protein] synthase-3
MDRATILGTGSYAPERIVPNAYFNDLYDEDVDSFLRENRNILQRHFAADEEATSDLAVAAGRKALVAAGITAAQVDLIIVSTDTPDYISPSTASRVQYLLGAVNAGFFDLNTACAGFVTALDTGAKFIAADTHYRYVLVVGAYLMSRYLDFSEKKIATLFADGAGAVVLGRSHDENGVLGAVLYGDGQYHDYMGIYAGGTAKPLSPDVLERKDHLLQFVKKIPLETNATFWPRLIRTLGERLHMDPHAVDRYFFTQININSINDTLAALGLPPERAHNVMDRFGYTGSACIPMALDDAVQNHLLKKGNLVFLVSSGGGIAMAVAAVRWSYDT